MFICLNPFEIRASLKQPQAANAMQAVNVLIPLKSGQA